MNYIIFLAAVAGSMFRKALDGFALMSGAILSALVFRVVFHIGITG